MFSATKARGNKYPPPLPPWACVSEALFFFPQPHKHLLCLMSKIWNKEWAAGYEHMKVPTQSPSFAHSAEGGGGRGVCLASLGAGFAACDGLQGDGTDMWTDRKSTNGGGRVLSQPSTRPSSTRARPRCIRAEAFNQVIFIFNKKKKKARRESIPSDVSAEGRCRQTAPSRRRAHAICFIAPVSPSSCSPLNLSARLVWAVRTPCVSDTCRGGGTGEEALPARYLNRVLKTSWGKVQADLYAVVNPNWFLCIPVFYVTIWMP